MQFREFFQSAFAQTELEPFAYQEALAAVDPFPNLIRVPTGLGKTAAVVLAWLWRRTLAGPQVRDRTPRRLIYCLPMRVLVEQTAHSILGWVQNLERCGALGSSSIPVFVLMGGEEPADWAIWPDRELILIGTQDMLLSRALNRGYAASRYRWPWEFGLLHQDTLWVFDEVQLMDTGMATSAQLEAFRRLWPQLRPSLSLWMSATLRPDWLQTVDLPKERLGRPLTLDDEDRKLPAVRERLAAYKRLLRSRARIGDIEACAKAVLEAHRPGSLTLAIFNTVDRAIEVYRRVSRSSGAKSVLLHSRFRPPDRAARLTEALKPPPREGTIVIATQVVEAGVDISAKTLLTELAPWPSLVQRLGRLNRYGEHNRSRDCLAIWFDWPDGEEEREKLAAPYSRSDLDQSQKRLEGLIDGSPAHVEGIGIAGDFRPEFVLRYRDLIELFDTSPDLGGADIDVSRFIRSGDELDVQVFWRAVPDGGTPDPDSDSGAAPRSEELCPVPYYQLRAFLGSKAQGRVWRWDPLERIWTAARAEQVFPGQTFLVDAGLGGYSAELGWNLRNDSQVPPVARPTLAPPAIDSDDGVTASGLWESVAEHTDRVVAELEAILLAIGLVDPELVEALKLAARWHDRGKAHLVFQTAIIRQAAPAEWADRLDIAKAPDGFWRPYSRRGFRHELASALHMLEAGLPDLATYVAAAHHGKVRLSIRSLPGERPPETDSSLLYARGLWEGDELPAVDLGGGVRAAAVRLRLDPMLLGRSAQGEPSWTERMVRLRDRWGPFQLAFFEALLRAADARASRRTQKGGASDATRD